MPRRLWIVLLALALALCGAGCNVTLSAGIDVREDGSGVVRAGVGFDDEAAAEVGDLSSALRADDLRQAGWEVTGPAEEADGLTWVRASKGFDHADEAAAVAAELSGPDGPFRDFTVTRQRTLLRTRTSFTGVVDLTAGLAGLSDPALQAALGDFDLGLERADGVVVRVDAKLPGKIDANLLPVVQDGRAVWTAAPGQRLELQADAELARFGPLVYAAAALTGASALLLVALRIRVRRRRRRPRR